jgi:endonuclease/exonuclease/phosphatase family metal-dependent hydrolase
MLVYSWNVLNPKYAEKTWGGVPEAKELGEKDQARTAYRQKAIQEVVRGWLKTGPTVVCLQEVWPALRFALKEEYGERCATGSLGEEMTLVAGCRIRASRTLAFPALVCDLDVGGRRVEVANVHFYWRWTDLGMAARALRGVHVVAGDFNKEWTQLGEMLRGRRGARLKATAVNPTTNELGEIDHVLASALFNKPRGRIVARAAGYTLRYGFSEIRKLRTPWLAARPMKDISDHSAIQARLTFSNKTRKHFPSKE